MRRRINKNKNPHLRRNLKYIRHYVLNCTQREIADTLSIDRSTYSYWEGGQVEPSLIMLKEVIEYFRKKGVVVDYNMLLLTDIVYEDLTFNENFTEE